MALEGQTEPQNPQPPQIPGSMLTKFPFDLIALAGQTSKQLLHPEISFLDIIKGFATEITCSDRCSDHA